ncbi:hypothetical protein ACFWU3_21755 [Streptomyces sp. NPDC058685]|uniref:hypothetical protein n=1 Tax=Streptomyces sp. NPDC058685 TaxID=3346598 RepID=UPI00365A920A
MLYEHRGRQPVVPESACVAPSAVLCGAVVLGRRACVPRGAVRTAEDDEVRIGADVVVMARQSRFYEAPTDDRRIDG